jgi:hypothetical protein
MDHLSKKSKKNICEMKHMRNTWIAEEFNTTIVLGEIQD